MAESEPKPKLIEPVAPGAGQGWKAVLKNGKPAVVHEIPVPPAEAAAAIPRIQRLADHRHPALSPVLAWGTDPNGIWVAVEPNEGTPLSTLLSRGPLTPPAAAALGAAVLSGVAALHEAGIAMGGFGASAVRITGNGEVRLAGHPAAAVRGAPSQSDLRADVRSCGMAVCAAFGVDPAGAPAPPNVPPGLVVTMRSMASGAMGPAADRAQGALREMASALLAPDRAVAAQAELATRAGGRDTPDVTTFLPGAAAAAAAVAAAAVAAAATQPPSPPALAPLVPPVPREETPVRAPVSYDAPPRSMQTYPAIPAPTYAPPPTPAISAAPPLPQEARPVPTWSEAPSRNPVPFGAPAIPAPVTPPAPPPTATNPPAAARETAPPAPSPFTPAGPRSPFETAVPAPAMSTNPPAATPPAPTAPPPVAPTPPQAPAQPTPAPVSTWTPVEAPVWTPGKVDSSSSPPAWVPGKSEPAPSAPAAYTPPSGTPTPSEPLAAPAAPFVAAAAAPFVAGAAPVAPAPNPFRAPGPAPARMPTVARRPSGGGFSERPTWLVPAIIAVVLVLLLGTGGFILAHRGGTSTAGVTTSPNTSPNTSPKTSPKASPKASPTSTQTPLAVPNFGPANADPITKVLICSTDTPCNVGGGNPAETATACDLTSCHVEVGIYFSGPQKVPVAYILKFFDRCTGTTTDLPGPKAFTPPGYVVVIPTDKWPVNIPSGVKSGALVAVAQQPGVAASAPLMLGANSCA
jgi:serine/threonine protein kinase